jgi:hypothetical protein
MGVCFTISNRVAPTSPFLFLDIAAHVLCLVVCRPMCLLALYEEVLVGREAMDPSKTRNAHI